MANISHFAYIFCFGFNKQNKQKILIVFNY